MSRLKLFPAGAPELVRSNQKDRFYTDHLSILLSEISRQILPLRLWLRWQREFQLVAELAYYGLTTVLGNQTLGEEYCNVVQVAPSDGPFVAPGFLRRTMPIVIQTLGAYAVEKGLEILYKKIRDRSLWIGELSEENYEKLEKIVENVEDIFSGASRFHLAFFYIYGIFYHFGKRLSGIKYLMIRCVNSQGTVKLTPLTTYRLLGWMILVQIAVKIVKRCYKMLQKNRKGSQEECRHSGEGGVGQEGGQVTIQTAGIGCKVRCPSCLEICQHPTAALCGHIFCWSCISDWTSEKAECPVCRTTVKPHQIICLQHF